MGSLLYCKERLENSAHISSHPALHVNHKWWDQVESNYMLESGVMAHHFTLLPDMKETLRCESRFDLHPVLGLRWGTLIRAIVDVLVNDQCQQSALYGVCSVLLSVLSNDERWTGSLRPSDMSWNCQNVISNFLKLISECKALTVTPLPHEGFCGYYHWNLVF